LTFLSKSEYEIILIDDGSSDSSIEKAIELKKVFAEVRLISMQNNHGHMRALETGMKESKGKYVLTMDCDLQDPPGALSEMYSIIKQSSVSCVQAVRVDRSNDTLLKKHSAQMYYKLIRLLTGVSVIRNAADFRMLSQEASEFLCKLPEKKKIFRLLIPYFGLKTIEYPIIRDHRVAGKTKYSVRKMFSLAIDSFLSFSTKPLRLILYSSVFFLFAAVSVGFFAIYGFVSGNTVPGWTSLVLVMIFLFSILMSGLSMIGIYVGRIYDEILNRPSLRYHEIF
jgi:dolichol-phosphate mannosyltransferase